MLYRAMTNLDTGKGTIRRGAVITEHQLSEVIRDVLLQRGAIAPISTPPLSAIPGWQKRSEKSAKAGVITVDQFIEANTEALARALRTKPEIICAWKTELERWLTIEDQES